ncbi:transglutaminase-like domain-containing protein [Flavobacterium sp. SUN046]|uniref:transglutaminase domain-containing protein n=1 Tax=Flavobacterium sp. SUN046 TaxID=3002440 RepID=UPI002DBE35B1|nr:transglutaminase-like domain-containing protein [Flavobacterium sp. SUN046]MEC4050008.1 transglutaminase-like domain-containing protein [Flavobacterium sp. SUN046]
MTKIFCFLGLLFCGFTFAQNDNPYESIDRKMDALPQSDANSTQLVANYIVGNFQNQEDRIRAIYYWTSNTISYDVANMFKQRPNQKREERIERTLRTQKGVCADYVALFNELSEKVGIVAYEVNGYTKQDGNVVLLAHAWSVAKIEGKWFLFDPTWGSGYVNHNVFYKRLENKFFKSDPSDFILTHMPYDYIWELLDYPINNDEFYENKITSTLSNPVFCNYTNEINQLEELSSFDKKVLSAKRVKESGLKNQLIQEYYNLINTNIDVELKNDSARILMSISSEFATANAHYNEFINFRNHKFEPQISDAALLNMIQVPFDESVKCISDFNSIPNLSPENIAKNKKFANALLEFKKLVEVQKKFVDDYLAKPMADRPKMFLVIRRK